MDKEGESEGNIEEGGSRSEVKDSGKPQIDSKKLKNGEHNHGEWTLVESLLRRKIKTLLGNKDQSGSEQHRIRVATVRSRDFWDIYLGCLAEDITKGEIESFLNENNVKMLDCWILKSKIYNSVSARVRIPLDMKDNILSADFWPKGIKVRSWVMKPRARSPMYEDIDE